MSSPIENKAAALAFPRSVASARGTFRIAVSGTAASLALPDDLKGCFVRVTARDATVNVGVGAAVTLVIGTTNTSFTDLKATVGASLKPDESLDGVIPKTATHLNVVASGSGTIEVFVSELASFNVG